MKSDGLAINLGDLVLSPQRLRALRTCSYLWAGWMGYQTHDTKILSFPSPRRIFAFSPPVPRRLLIFNMLNINELKIKSPGQAETFRYLYGIYNTKVKPDINLQKKLGQKNETAPFLSSHHFFLKNASLVSRLRIFSGNHGFGISRCSSFLILDLPARFRSLCLKLFNL